MNRRIFFKYIGISAIGTNVSIHTTKPVIGGISHTAELIKKRKVYKVLQRESMMLGDKILEVYYRMKQMNIKHYINTNVGATAFQSANKIR